MGSSEHSLYFPWPTPTAPEWKVDWDSFASKFPFLEELKGIPQDPSHPAEGDVWTHTRMVVEALAAMPAWRQLFSGHRDTVFAAALLHDVGKVETTKIDVETGKITSKGHSKRGEIKARNILWSLGVDPVVREQVASLIRFHQMPFIFTDRENPRYELIRVSQIANCEFLAMLAEADGWGRICTDQRSIIFSVDYFSTCCKEEGCFKHPKEFGNSHSRVQYFHSKTRDPAWTAFDDTEFTVTMLSGLPGSGKDTWVAKHGNGLPVISLDDLRKEMDIPSGTPQGKVIHAAQDAAKVYLRAKKPFIFNATNLSQEIRGKWNSLFLDYNAKIKIVYLEVPQDKQKTWNASRAEKVPEDVIAKMMTKWEVPDLTEAHEVQCLW